jgi:hypothetical protein
VRLPSAPASPSGPQLVAVLPAFVVLSVLAVLGGVRATPAAAEVATRYELPVDGAVLRPFEAPEHAYGAGHRGVDLAAPAGTPVRAAAGGEVTFAGAVAGDRWVTLRHPDGIVTSYGAFRSLGVAAGDTVTRGQPLGTAAGRHGDEVLRPEAGLHWSARRAGAYLDPLELLGAATLQPTLSGEGGWWATHARVVPYDRYEGGARWGILATPSPEADRRGYARAPNDHRLLLVPGYGSEGPEAFLDAEHLGYDPDDISVFSYRGCVPTPTGCEPRAYGGQDTDLTIDEAARLLDAQLRALQRAQPHRPVDLIGHSMGGDVAVHWATYHHDPDDLGLPPVRNVATIATPHGGSGIASVPRAIGDDALVGRLVELGRLGAAAVGWGPAERMSTVSRPVQRYGAPVWAARPERDAEALAAKGVRVQQLAGSRDLVVGRTDAGFDGHALVLPGGHGTVLGTEAARQALHPFLAGGEPDITVGSRVGVGSDLVSDAGRTVGTLLDVWPLRTFTRALDVGDAGTAFYEAAKAVVGGPSSRNEDHDPLADLPLVPERAAEPSGRTR